MRLGGWTWYQCGLGKEKREEEDLKWRRVWALGRAEWGYQQRTSQQGRPGTGGKMPVWQLKGEFSTQLDVWAGVQHRHRWAAERTEKASTAATEGVR